MAHFFNCGPLQVRPLTPNDYSLLAKWLSDVHVLEFYEGRDRPYNMLKVANVFGKKLVRKVTPCIVEYESKAIGYIQFYPLANEDHLIYGFSPQERVYGLDQFIGEPNQWNRGIGTLLVSETAKYVMKRFDVDFIVVDPQVSNTRAIRCYEKAGFQKKSLLLNHEWHEGAYRDCLLMVWCGEGHYLARKSVQFVSINPQQADDTVISILSEAVFEPIPERIATILQDVYGRKETVLFRLDKDSRTVAVVGIRRVGGGKAELLHIAVQPTERGSGYGRTCVQQLVHFGEIQELFAETDSDAVGFYRQCGFEITPLGEKYPGRERFFCRLVVSQGDEI